MTSKSGMIQIGDFRFDPSTGELSRGDAVERLRPQAAHALTLLIDHAGSMVSRDQLQAAIWPDTHVEYDLSLNVCIRQIRAALGDDAEAPTYVETLPRRGYRLIAPVTIDQAPLHEPPTYGNRLRRNLTTVGLVAGVAILAAVVVANRPAPGPISIAVMPFRSIPESDSLTYLEDGLTEELITALAGVNPDHLRVIARTSSFGLAADGMTANEVGKTLGVDYVLTGALRQVPLGYRVTAQLLDVATGIYAWSDSYDLSATEVLHLERYVAARVTLALGPELGTASENDLVATSDPRARDAVLRARHLLSNRTRTSAARAVSDLSGALVQDSSDADLYITLARAHLQLGGFDAADTAIARARAIQPTSAARDAVAGQVALYGRSDPARAVQLLARAVSIQPGAADLRRLFANALVANGQPQEAVTHGERALELDPVSSLVRGDMGWVFYYARDFSRARQVCQSTLELSPASLSAQECVILAAALDGTLADEVTLVREAVTALGASASTADSLGNGVAEGNGSPLWRWLVDDPDRRRQLGPVNEARVLALLQRDDEAATALTRAATLGANTVLFVRVDPVLERVVAHTGVRKALERAGLGGS